MSTAVLPLCFLKSTDGMADYQETLYHFLLLSADKINGDADFIFRQDPEAVHIAQIKTCFDNHDVTVPANSSDLNPKQNLVFLSGISETIKLAMQMS